MFATAPIANYSRSIFQDSCWNEQLLLLPMLPQFRMLQLSVLILPPLAPPPPFSPLLGGQRVHTSIPVDPQSRSSECCPLPCNSSTIPAVVWFHRHIVAAAACGGVEAAALRYSPAAALVGPVLAVSCPGRFWALHTAATA